MANKTFVGSGKSKSPQWIKGTISEKGLQILLENLQEYNGNKFAKIDINVLPQPNKFGKDVEITLDTWQPSGEQKPKEAQGSQENKESGTDPDLPF